MPEEQPDDGTESEPQQSETNWQFKAEDDQSATTKTKSKSLNAGVSWSASEFIAHDKSTSWYAMLIIGTIFLAGFAFLITREITTIGVIIIVAIIFGVMASRKPRELPYTVNDQGVQIGAKQYSYNLFRSFSIVQEGAIESIWFMPLRRFMPIITIYFEPKDQAKIINILEANLPVEDHQLDPVDRLMHKIRF